MNRLLVALAATTLTSTAAIAAPSITYYTPDADGSFGATFGNQPKNNSPFANPFNDLFMPFTVTRAGLLTATITTSSSRPSNDIDFSFAEIIGPGLMPLRIPFTITRSANGTSNPDSLEQGDTGDVRIGPGTYQLHVVGSLAGGIVSAPRNTGTYSGTINFAAAPEPAAWALMIVGFGAVGCAMRRQRRTFRIAYS